MALNIQIPYRGDQYLYQGLSGAATQIGQHIEQLAADLKQKKALRTMAVDGLGLDKDQVDQMSLPQLQGTLQGAAMKEHLQQFGTQQAAAQQALAAGQQQMEAEAQKIAQFKRAQDQQTALESFGRDYAQGPPPDNALFAPGPPLNRTAEIAAARNASPEQRFMSALGRNPAAFVSPQFDNSMGALTRFERPTDKIPISELGKPTPIPGMPGQFFVPTSTGGGQVTTGPDRQAQRVFDESGNHVGYMAGTRFLSRDELEGVPKNAELEEVKTKSGKVIPGWYRDVKTGVIHKSSPSILDQLGAAGLVGPSYAPGAATKGGSDPLGLGIK